MSSNKKKLAAVAAVAAVGVGGALLYYKYRQQKHQGASDEEAIFTKEPIATAASSEKRTVSSSRTVTDHTTTHTTTSTNSISKSPSASVGSTAVSSSPPTATHSLRQPLPEYVDFEKYHCRVRPAVGWEAVSEPSPIPTSGVILIRRPEFAEMMQQQVPHGSIPMILVSIEDVSVDGTTAEEVKDKAVVMARQQMLMMTDGMIHPHVECDKKVSNAGIFDYYVEMNQLIPGMMDMRTAMYIAVKDGIAFSFQLIASPQVYNENKNVFLQMVRDFQVIDVASKDYTEIAYLEHRVKEISVKTPPQWKARPNTEEGVLAEFVTSSETRPETITIYRGDDMHRPGASAANIKTTVVGGVTIQNYTEGASHRERRRIAIGGKYTVISVPQKTTKGVTTDHVLVAFAKSIQHSSTPTTDIYFVNVSDKYKCVIRNNNSSIIHSVLGDGSVMYFPSGMEAMREGNSDEPSVTIRCGHPDTDETCATTLMEWRQRMLQEEKSIKHIEDAVIDGNPAITFNTVEMQMTGPSSSSEVKTCVYITVRKDGSTCLIRWECDTGAFRRNERNMINFVDSFRML